MYGKPVYCFSEVRWDATDYAEKRCANLREMCDLGIPVPEGIAVSLMAYEIFIDLNGIQNTLGITAGQRQRDVLDSIRLLLQGTGERG